MGNAVIYTYDKNGNILTETTTQTGLVITYSGYDGLNRPATMSQAVRRGGPGSSVDTYTTHFQYDDATNTVTTTDPDGSVTVIVRDGLNRVHSQTIDPGNLNLETTYTYDADGNLKSETDAAGNTTTYFYDGRDRQIEIDYPITADDTTPVKEQFYYDGDNNIVKAIDKRGVVSTTSYDNLNRVTDQVLIESLSNNGAPLTLSHFAYTDTGAGGTYSVVRTDADGNPTTTRYDALGRALVVTDPMGYTTKDTYDGVDLISETDANGNETDYTYDADNRQTSTMEHAGSGGGVLTTTSVVYDDANNQVQTYDRDGIETIEQYDSLNRVTQVSRKDAAMESYYDQTGGEVVVQQTFYDGNNNIVMTIAGSGADTTTTKYDYDAANREIDEIAVDPSGPDAETYYTYDKVGNLRTITDPRTNQVATTYTYDARYRVTSESDGDNDTTSYTYDANNNMTSKTDPKGNLTEYSYDELNDLLWIDQSASQGGISIYVYDGNRNKIAQQDPDGNLVVYQYDARNELTDTYQDLSPGTLGKGSTRASVQGAGTANALHWHSEYDGNGNQTMVTDPKNQTTMMTYDYLDRVQHVEYVNPAEPNLDFQPVSLDYTYDGNGNILSVVEKEMVQGSMVTETSSFTYDKFNNVKTSTNSDDLTMAYTYDAQGNETSVTYPDGSVDTYIYDGRERLVTVETPAGDTHYAYWLDGLTKYVQYANGVVEDFSFDNSYDGANRLTYVVNHTGAPGTVPSGNQFISSFTYTYDANGNRSSEVEIHQDLDGGAAITTTYGYDALNRLESATYSTGGSLTYNYDNAGNRLSEVGSDPSNPGQAVNLSYHYDAINRLTGITDNLTPAKSVVYSYDANGNRISQTVAGVTTIYKYNILDQLVQTTDKDGGKVEFDYDFTGMRTKTISNSGEVKDLYDAHGNLMRQYTVSNQLIAQYTYGIDLISVVNGSSSGQAQTPLYYSKDGLGSSSELTDASGGVQASYEYDAWGNVIQTSGGTSNVIQFTGQVADPEIGLDYFGARYYDPSSGTFISQDTHLGSGMSPISLNRYVYADANPLRYTDPTGHDRNPYDDIPPPEPLPDPNAPAAQDAEPFDLGAALRAASAKEKHELPPGVDYEVKETVINANEPLEGGSTVQFEAGSYLSFAVLGHEDGLKLGDPISMRDNAVLSNVQQAYEKSKAETRPFEYGIILIAGAPLALPEIGAGIGATLFGVFAASSELSAGVLSIATGTEVPTPIQLASEATASLITDHLPVDPIWKSRINTAIGFAFNIAVPAALDSAISRSLVKSVKNAGLEYAPSTGATTLERKIISDVAAEKNVAVGVRAADPLTATVTRIGNRLFGLPPKPDVDKAKSTFGVLIGLSGNLTISDLDSAYVQSLETGEFLTGNAEKEILDEINSRLAKARGLSDEAAALQAPFQHGSQINALPQFGGPKYVSTGDYANIGGTGPVVEFSARGMVTLGEKSVFDQYATAAAQRGVSVEDLWPWAKPKLVSDSSSTLLSSASNASVVDVSTATAMANVAKEIWSQSDPAATLPALNVVIEDLPDGELGEVTITAMGTNGLPTAATIFLSPNAAGAGWYVDPTPDDHSEFPTQLASDAYSAAASPTSLAASQYDLLTTLLHEEGHLLGFDSAPPRLCHSPWSSLWVSDLRRTGTVGDCHPRCR